MTKILCIYHGGCDDGFGAAWAVRHALGDANVEFYPGVYQQEPPDCTGRDVLLVDFSYKRPVLDAIASVAASVMVIDHHKTAEAELGGWPRGDSFLKVDREIPGIFFADKAEIEGNKCCYFDMARSGAGLAWDLMHPGVDRPVFIDYIEDRDLWKKALPDGDEFTIALRSYPQTFEQWDALFATNLDFYGVENVDRLIAEGRAIQRYYRARVEEMKKSAYLGQMGMKDSDPPFAASDEPHGAFVNVPYFAASEVAGEIPDLFGDAQYGASYFEVKPGIWQYSLRSRGDFDVSEIAKRFGGGGHKNAAGFSVAQPMHVKS